MKAFSKLFLNEKSLNKILAAIYEIQYPYTNQALSLKYITSSYLKNGHTYPTYHISVTTYSSNSTITLLINGKVSDEVYYKELEKNNYSYSQIIGNTLPETIKLLHQLADKLKGGYLLENDVISSNLIKM